MSLDPLANPLTTGTRWRIVFLLFLFALFGHFNRVGISVAGTEIFIKKYELSTTKMGWVYTSFLIAYSAGMLPGGWLIDRIGSRRAMTIYGISMGIFVALTGVLGWFVKDAYGLWIGLLLIRSCAGICSAPLHPGAAHVISDLMPDRSRATANGMVTAGALVGIAFCYPIFGALVDLFDWPAAFVICGLTMVVYATVWSRVASCNWGREQSSQPTSESNSSDTFSRAPLLNTNICLLAISYAAYGYFQYLFFYWMGYYFEEVLHVPDTQARWTSFWIMLAQGAGMAVGGLSTDVVCKLLGLANGRRLIVVSGMGLGGLFGLLAVFSHTQFAVAGCLAISMAALGICEGVFWTTATDLGGRSRGFSGAFMNTGGNIGGLVSPVLTPVMAKQIGWSGSIGVACAVAALGGMIWFLIRFPERTSTDTPATA